MGGYYYIITFIIGLLLGSFFNVIIFRFNTKKSAIKGRSRCVKCNSVIKWFDLIPVLSYFLLKRKCRYCGGKISPSYPVVEIATAISLLLFLWKNPTLSFPTVLGVFAVLLFLLIIFFDIRFFIIPDKILVLLVPAIVGLKFLGDDTDFYQLLISASALTSFFAILFLVSRGRWIGMGDVKLIFLIGFLLGYPASYLAVLSAIWFAAIFSVVLLVNRTGNMKTEVPFGSFLSVSTIIFIIFNNELQEISKLFY